MTSSAEMNRAWLKDKRMEDQIDRLTAALEECLEYFQERQDGEYIDGKPVGNAEMRLGQMVEEALGRGGRYG